MWAQKTFHRSCQDLLKSSQNFALRFEAFLPKGERHRKIDPSGPRAWRVNLGPNLQAPEIWSFILACYLGERYS